MSNYRELINYRNILRSFKSCESRKYTYDGDYYPIPTRTYREAFRLLNELIYDSQIIGEDLPGLRISSNCDSQEVSIFFGWEFNRPTEVEIWITVKYENNQFVYGILYCPSPDELTWKESEEFTTKVIYHPYWQMFLDLLAEKRFSN